MLPSPSTTSPSTNPAARPWAMMRAVLFGVLGVGLLSCFIFFAWTFHTKELAQIEANLEEKLTAVQDVRLKEREEERDREKKEHEQELDRLKKEHEEELGRLKKEHDDSEVRLKKELEATANKTKMTLKGVRVGIVVGTLDYRGTGRASVDSGQILQKHGAQVIVFTLAKYHNNNPSVSEESTNRFLENFPVVFSMDYENLGNMNAVVQLWQTFHIDVWFMFKSGQRSDPPNQALMRRLRPSPTIVWCVFKSNEPHAAMYTAISPWVPGNPDLVLPHIVKTEPSDVNWRQKLSIPADALVLCRHGGLDTFDDQLIRDGVVASLSRRTDLHYVFVSTPEFGPQGADRARMHFLDPVNPQRIQEFINTCDGMVYGRTHGETFGLAIAEFSMSNKFIIANRKIDGFHRAVLQNDIMLVDSANQYADLVQNLDRQATKQKNWDKYSELFS